MQLFRRLSLLAAVFSLFAVHSAHAFDWIGRVELDAEGLRAAEESDRVDAVQRLGQYDIAWVKPYLMRALKDPSERVRAAAARLLGRAGVEEAIPMVIPWLSSAVVDEKKVAAAVLGAIGSSKAIPALIRSLGDVDHEVRHQAVLALGRIGSQQAVVPMIARLEDDKPSVRQAAIEELTRLGDRRAVVPLVGVFGDSSLDVRVAAVVAVGRLRDPAAVPALMRLIDDPMERVRIAAVTALGSIRAVRATDTLIELFDTGSNEFRAKVAFALGQIAKYSDDNDAAWSAVSTLVSGLGNTRVQAASREALLAAGSKAVPALIAHLRGKLEGDPSVAVRLLRDIGDPRATPALIDELHRARIPRGEVLEALGKSGDSRALVPVLSLLEDSDASVRLRAMRAIGNMIEPGGRAGDVLVQYLNDDSTEMRELAARYLGKSGARAVVPKLLAALDKERAVSVRRAHHRRTGRFSAIGARPGPF